MSPRSQFIGGTLKVGVRATSGWCRRCRGICAACVMASRLRLERGGHSAQVGTCRGASWSEFDYFAVSQGMEPMVNEIRVLSEAGTSPHWPVAIKLEVKPDIMRGRCLVVPKRSALLNSPRHEAQTGGPQLPIHRGRIAWARRAGLSPLQRLRHPMVQQARCWRWQQCLQTRAVVAA